MTAGNGQLKLSIRDLACAAAFIIGQTLLLGAYAETIKTDIAVLKSEVRRIASLETKVGQVDRLETRVNEHDRRLERLER